MANPANTNALILKEHAPSIPAQNISALTRLDHNRALGQACPALGLGARQNTQGQAIQSCPRGPAGCQLAGQSTRSPVVAGPGTLAGRPKTPLAEHASGCTLLRCLLDCWDA